MAKRKKTPNILAGLQVADAPQQEQPQKSPQRTQAASSTASGKAKRRTRKPSVPQQPVPTPALPEAPQPSVPSAQHGQHRLKRTLPLPFSARIKLTLSAPDQLQDRLHTAFIHALHEVEDVQLMQEEHEWELMLLGVPLQTAQGSPFGIALSGVIVHDHRPFQSVSDFQGTWLRVHAEEHLQRMCDDIIADFNQRYLEPQRAAHRKLVETSDQQDERGQTLQ